MVILITTVKIKHLSFLTSLFLSLSVSLCLSKTQIFKGDFVDRGPKQCEVLLTILYAFLLFPNRVFLNRGNHEDISLNLYLNLSFIFDNISARIIKLNILRLINI